MSFFAPTPTWARGLIKRNPSPACNIRPDSVLWCVSGRNPEGGGGILRWCFDRDDALFWYDVYILAGYTEVSAHKYLDC